jgi:hypothetical protein
MRCIEVPCSAAADAAPGVQLSAILEEALTSLLRYPITPALSGMKLPSPWMRNGDSFIRVPRLGGSSIVTLRGPLACNL